MGNLRKKHGIGEPSCDPMDCLTIFCLLALVAKNCVLCQKNLGIGMVYTKNKNSLVKVVLILAIFSVLIKDLKKKKFFFFFLSFSSQDRFIIFCANNKFLN